MKPKHLFPTVLLAAGIAAGAGGLPGAVHGQDESDVNDFEKDPFGASERMLGRMRDYDRELQGEKRDAEQERLRQLESNTGGRHLRDVSFVNPIYSLVFGADGKHLFCGLGDGTVCAANIETGKQDFALKLARNPITALAVSPDGRYLMAGCAAERLVRTWDVVKGKEIARVEVAKPWSVEQIQLSSHGRYMAVAGWRGTYQGIGYLQRPVTRYAADPLIYIYDTRSGELLRSLQCDTDPINRIALSSDGASLAVEVPYGVQLWRCESPGSLRAKITMIHGASRCSFSPDGRQLAAIGKSLDDYLSYYSVLRIVDASQGKQVNEYHVGEADLREIRDAPAFSPSCKSVAYRLDDPNDRVSIINLSTSQKLYLPNADEEIGSICFSPDGGRLAGVRISSYLDPDSNMTVRIWGIPSDGPAKVHPASTSVNVESQSSPGTLPGISELEDNSVASSSTTGGPLRPSWVVVSIVTVLVLICAIRARTKKASSALTITPTAKEPSHAPARAPLQHSKPADILGGTGPFAKPLAGGMKAMCADDSMAPLRSTINCPSCGTRLRVPEGLSRATKVSCKGCQHVFRFGAAQSIVSPITHVETATSSVH